MAMEAGAYFETMNKLAFMPERATKRSAGYDFRAPYDFEIAPGETKIVMSDVRAKLEDNQFLQLVSRSSVGIKRKVTIAQGVGTIDADYYDNEKNGGNIGLPLHNYGDEVQRFTRGDAVAQGIIQTYDTVAGDTADRERTGGFGHTGR
jgi:dUTP pyrophosphatase